MVVSGRAIERWRSSVSEVLRFVTILGGVSEVHGNVGVADDIGGAEGG